MEEHAFLKIKHELPPVADYHSIYFLYQEGFELPSSLNNIYDTVQLFDVLRKIDSALDYSIHHLFHVGKFVPHTDAEGFVMPEPVGIEAKKRKIAEKGATTTTDRWKTLLSSSKVSTTSQVSDTKTTDKEDASAAKKGFFRLKSNTANLFTPSESAVSEKQERKIPPAIVNLLSLQSEKLKKLTEDTTTTLPETPLERVKKQTTIDAGSEDSEEEQETIDEQQMEKMRQEMQRRQREFWQKRDAGNNVLPVATRSRDESETQLQPLVQKKQEQKKTVFAGVVSKNEMQVAMFLEIECTKDLFQVLDAYRMRNANELLKNQVYFCSVEKITKNIAPFDLLFLLICKCRYIVSLWDSLHVQKIYEKSAADFEFARDCRLVLTQKPILSYSANEVLCNVKMLSEKWRLLVYCEELEAFIDLLLLRIALLIIHVDNEKVHDIPKYRREISPNNYTASQDFISNMAVYLYAFRKKFRIREMFVNCSVYHMHLLFNTEHSHLLLARIGYDTSKFSLTDAKTEKRAALTALLAAGGVNYEGAVDETMSAASEKDGQKICTEIEQVYGSICPSLPKFGDEKTLKITLFINDELFKIFTNHDISFHLMAWMQTRAVKLSQHGEDTIRMYRKMCLNYCVLLGEDIMCTRNISVQTKTIETVLKNQRGIKLFNKTQEKVGEDPKNILPDVFDLFKECTAGYSENSLKTILQSRSKNKYELFHDREELCNSPLQADYCAFSHSKQHLPAELSEKETNLINRLHLDVFQELLIVLLVDNFFENFFALSYEAVYVIYERELEEKYDSYTRMGFPMLVQTFNGFNLLYNGIVYEVNNVIVCFYLWMRIVDQFHGSQTSGRDVRKMFYEIFGSEKYYREKCQISVSQMIDEHASKIKNEDVGLSESVREQEKSEKFSELLEKSEMVSNFDYRF